MINDELEQGMQEGMSEAVQETIEKVPVYFPQADTINVTREKQMEDQVFNTFIDENIGINIGALQDYTHTKYIQSNPESQDAYNVLAYQIISKDYNDHIKRNPK